LCKWCFSCRLIHMLFLYIGFG